MIMSMGMLINKWTDLEVESVHFHITITGELVSHLPTGRF